MPFIKLWHSQRSSNFPAFSMSLDLHKLFLKKKKNVWTLWFFRFGLACRHGIIVITDDTVSIERKSIVVFQQEHTPTTHIVWGGERARFGQSFSTKDQNWRCHDWTYRRLCDGICHVIIYWLFFILCWKLQASLHLIQELFVEIADGVKVPHKVLSLISKMKMSVWVTITGWLTLLQTKFIYVKTI